MFKFIIEDIESLFEFQMKKRKFYERDEEYKTFFDIIEIGDSENAKALLFRKLQDIAKGKSLQLTTDDGLKDPMTNRGLVNKETDKPIEKLFKYLDLDDLNKIPVRNVTIADVVKVLNQQEKSFDSDETTEYMMVITSDPTNPVDNEAAIKLLNNVLFSIKVSVSNAGTTSNDDSSMYTNKYKVFAPKDVERDDLTDLINKNKDLLKELGIKSVDVVED